MERKKVFLAHANEDKPKVRSLYRKLTNAGFDVWLDEESVPPGANWKQEIEKAINATDFFLACISATSVDKTGYVQKEFRVALNELAKRPKLSNRIIPITLDDSIIPDISIGSISLADFNGISLCAPDDTERLIDHLMGTPVEKRNSKYSQRITELKEKLANGQLAEVLKEFDELVEDHHYRDKHTLTLLRARVADLEYQSRRGILTPDYRAMEIARIRSTLVDMLQEKQDTH